MKQYLVAFFVVAVVGTLAAAAAAPPAAGGTEAAVTADAANAWRTSSESPSIDLLPLSR